MDTSIFLANYTIFVLSFTWHTRYKMKFEHFLLTKFNLNTGQEHWHTDKNGNPTLTKEWLTHRLGLFFNFCLPSIINQKNKQFKWLILFDSKTPKNVLNLFNSLQVNIDLKLLLIDSKKNLNQDLVHYISTVIPKEKKYIITSRLDNDDMLHRLAIDKIQKNFREAKYLPIHLKRGYTLNLDNKNIFTLCKYDSGPFLSLVEKWDKKSVKTIYHKKHDEFIDDQGMVQIDKGRYWIQVIHERNLANQIRGIPILWKPSLRSFGIPPNIIKLDMKNTISVFIKKLYNKLLKAKKQHQL